MTYLISPAGQRIALAVGDVAELMLLVQRLNALHGQAEKLRELSEFAERLSRGPFNLPLDQMMRLSNELLGWRDELKRISGQLDELAISRSGMKDQ